MEKKKKTCQKNNRQWVQFLMPKRSSLMVTKKFTLIKWICTAHSWIKTVRLCLHIDNRHFSTLFHFKKEKTKQKKNRYNRCASIFQNASKPPLIAPELNRLESQGRREDVSLKTEKKTKQKKKHINDILDACVPQNEDSKDASLVATAASLTVAPPQTLKQSLFRLLRKKKP